MSKLVSNYMYNSFYQLLVLFVPLILTPYLARVLGPEGIGISAYSLSIVHVFMLFASMGISLYGNRQVAAAKNKGKEELSKEFWSIFSIQFLSSVIVLAVYIVFILLILDNNQPIFWAQSFLILSSLIDITWFYIGIEELKKTVIRNTIVRIGSLLLVFAFVNQPEDLIIYILINSITQLVGQAVLWLQLFRYVKPTAIKLSNITIHLKPLFVVFLSQIIIQLYVVVDKIILGLCSEEAEVGFYDQASKIVKMTLSVITSLSTVMLPRIASEFSQGNYDKIKKYFSITIQFILLMTLPMTVGLAGVANTMVPWFFGPGYEKVAVLIVIMSPTILFIGLSNLFGYQILLPTNRQSKLTISVSVGAIISVVVNIILVQEMESIGTAIATLIAEVLVVLVQLFFVIKLINFKELMKGFFKYSVISIVMGFVVFFIGSCFNKATVLVTILQVSAGVLVYFGILLLIKDKFLYQLINLVLRRKRA